MGEIARHSRPCVESPDTIVREHEMLDISTEHGVQLVRYATIERLTRNRFGGHEFERVGAGTIGVEQ